MKKLIIVILVLLFCTPINGALVEKYCNCDLGTGANDGSSEANAWQTLAAAFTGIAAGQRLNVKKTAARYSGGAAESFAVTATAMAPIHIRGYGSTIGDHTMFEMSEKLSITGDADCVLLEDFDIDVSNSTAKSLSVHGDNSCVYHCKVKSTNALGEAAEIHDATMVNCTLETTGASASYVVQVHRAILHGCLIKASTRGIYISAGYNDVVAFNRILGPANTGTTEGIYMELLDSSEGQLIIGNSIYKFADGIEIVTMPDVLDTTRVLYINNIIYNVTNGIDNNESASQTVGIHFINNAIGGASGNRYNGFGDVPIISDITLSADPWTDAANGDLSLNNTAGAGVLCRMLAIPIKYTITGSKDNWLDIGSHQREVTAGGGTTNIFINDRCGGKN